MTATPQGSMTGLTAADGHSFDCWVEPAQDPARGGLVVIQEIFGITDQLKELAAAYAADGYEVAIPGLFDRQEPGVVIPFSEGPRGRELMMASDPDKAVMDIAAAVQSLKSKGKVAVMGFCWGGGLTIRAAQDLDIAAAISFYGTRLPEYLDRSAEAPLQGHFGTSDSHTPPEDLAQAQAYFTDFKVYIYDAGHAFANHHRPESYNEAAANLAHERARAFLALHVG